MERWWMYLCVALTCLVCRGTAFDDDNLFWCSGNRFVFMNTTKQWLSGSVDVYYKTVSFSNPNAVLSASSYMYRKDFLVFSDKGTRTIFLYKDKPQGQGVYAHVGVSEGIGELAVDWLNFNVYWCDGIYSWIGLQALPRDINRIVNNDKQRIIVDKALVKPYGLAVSPHQRFIFWTDYGDIPRIERASLSGKSRRTLIWMGLKKPMSITVDPSTDKLFWIDNARATIETCDFEGQGRRVLVQRLGYSLTSVTVFEEHLLYTEAKDRSIHPVSKVTGSQSARDLTIDVQPTGVAVFTESLQPFTTSACDTHGCSHICVQEAGGPTCLCEGGFNLAVDGKTCSASSSNNLWKNILYSTGDQICSVPVTTLNSYAYIPVEVTCLTSDVNVTFLALEAQSASVFYSSGQSVKRKLIGGGTFTVTTTTNVITGLVLDPINRNVIWSEKAARVIRGAAVGINSPSTDIFTDLRAPAALTIASKTRRLFWISDTSPARIETGNIAGGTATVLVGSDLKQPVRLIFDPLRNRLYWTEDGRIGSILADGTMRMNYPHNPLPSYIGITVFKDYLVWSVKEQTANMSVSVLTSSKGTINTPITFSIPGTESVEDLAVYDTDSNPADVSGCDSNNGGCQQICLPNDDTHMCQCNFGFKLQTDRKTCRSDTVDTDFYLVLDDVHNSMYQVVSSDIVHGVGILTANTPSIITYDTRRRKVLWYDAVRKLISKANLDGSEESVVIGTENMVVQDMTVDPSTSNIYYTVTSGDVDSGSVRVVTHDGVTRRTLIQTTGTPGPLAINPKSGLLIWGEGSVIKMADMSGSGVSTLVSSGLNSVTDLDIDTNGEVLYVADSTGDKIESVVLQTRSRKQLRQNTQEFPTAISIKGDNLNYLTKKGRSIKVIHKTTGEELPAVADVAEFGRLSALYVYIDGQSIANSACFNSNGDCSTLCLPTSSGRKCACADGLSLKEDKKICEQAVKCPEPLLHGKLAADCSPYVNNVCKYSCDNGYETNFSTRILCSKTGIWNASLDKLCVAKKEPVTAIPPEPVPVAVIAGACAAAVVAVAVIVLVVICLKRRRAARSRQPHIRATWSKEPIITVTDKSEVYDEIGQPQDDEERYSSFSRISPHSQRRNLRDLSEITNPAYVSSQDAQYLTVDRLPIPLPRPASSFTPNTRKKMYRSESPAPDYETPNSESPAVSYVDLTNYQDEIPAESFKV